MGAVCGSDKPSRFRFEVDTPQRHGKRVGGMDHPFTPNINRHNGESDEDFHMRLKLDRYIPKEGIDQYGNRGTHLVTASAWDRLLGEDTLEVAATKRSHRCASGRASGRASSIASSRGSSRNSVWISAGPLDFEDMSLKHCLEAMGAQMEKAAIQVAACDAMRTNFLRDAKEIYGNGHKHPGTALLKANGLGPVLSALDAHGANVQLTESGLWLVERMVALDADKAKVVRGWKAAFRRANGTSIVIGSLGQHTDSASVQEFGCQILYSLAKNDADFKMSVGGLNGIEAVLAALAAHPESIEVKAPALQALRVLAGDRQNRRKMVKLGVINVIIKELTSHGKFAGLPGLVCEGLVAIGHEDAGYQAEIFEAGAIQPILTAMKRSPNNSALQEQACIAMRCILGSDAERKREAVAAGIIELVMAAFTCGGTTRGDADPVLDQASLLVIDLATDCPEVRAKFVELGAAQVLKDATTTDADAKSQRAAGKALKLLEAKGQ